LINNVCDNLKNLIFKINNLNGAEDPIEFELQKEKIEKVMKNMINYQKKIYNLYSNLEEVETCIKKKIVGIEPLEISEFLILKNENKTTTSYGFIAKENLISDVSKIKFYSELEYNCLKEIHSCYIYFSEKYDSNNKCIFFLIIYQICPRI